MVPQDEQTLQHKGAIKSLSVQGLSWQYYRQKGEAGTKDTMWRVKVCVLLVPAGRNWRGLKCWLWSLIWFTSLLSLFLWKSSDGREFIWGLQVSFHCASLRLSHIRDKQRTVTPGLFGGAQGRLPEKGVWAECRGWAESGRCTWVS